MDATEAAYVQDLETKLTEVMTERENLRRHLAWSVVSIGGRVAIPAELVISDPPFTILYAQDSRGETLFIEAELVD